MIKGIGRFPSAMRNFFLLALFLFCIFPIHVATAGWVDDVKDQLHGKYPEPPPDNPSIYSFDIAATDTHGSGTLIINLKKQTFVFEGRGFDPDQTYFLHYNKWGTPRIQVFASAVTTPSGDLRVEGEWKRNLAQLPTAEDFGLSTYVNVSYVVLMQDFIRVIKNKVLMTQTGADIKAGTLKNGGSKGSAAVFGILNAAVSKYRYTNIMDELNTMGDKVDELLADVEAIQQQLDGIENMITGLDSWIKTEAALGTHLSDAEVWVEQYFKSITNTAKSYNWALWNVAGCDNVSTIKCLSGACVGGATEGAACARDDDCWTCSNEVTDESMEIFNDSYYTTSLYPINPPDLLTDNFYLWWAYAVMGYQASGIETYKVNGSTADALVDFLHQGMVSNPGTDENGLQAYLNYIFNQSRCGKAGDVTACDLYTDVYLPFEAYFQQVITTQITLVQAIVEAQAELASFYETFLELNSHDDDVINTMAGFQQKLSEEAEVFLELAEQIALYRAADGTVDWSSFNTSDAGQLLARADFLAARLLESDSGKPWPWPPGVTGRIFYTEQQEVPSSATVHNACIDNICTPLTEVVPLLEDFVCVADDNYPGQCLLTDGWPYLQWSEPDSNNIVTGVPTQIWKIRRLTPQQMAAGTYQVASINAQYQDAELVVSEYGDDYSNPPNEGTTPVLFGSFNGLEGKLGIGAIGANRTFSGGSDDNLHDFTVTIYDNYAEMNVVYKNDDVHKTADWYEKIKIKVPDNDLFDTYPMVKVMWPSTIEAKLDSSRSGPCCDDWYYEKVEQSLWLLTQKGSNTSAGYKFPTCPADPNLGFKSCNYVEEDRNAGMMLRSDPIALDHSAGYYTLQAHFSDDVWGFYGTYAYNCYCRLAPSSTSHVTWRVYNPTITMTK